MTTFVPNHNRTLYEITDNVHKGILISWCFILGIFSIGGNTLVLVASIKYRALKLDKISVMLIKHIGFADLCYALVVILMVGWSMIENDWPMNHALCEVSVYLQYFLALVDINLIWVLNVAKLTCIIYPFRARLRSKSTGYLLAASMWVFSNIYPLQCAAMRRTVYFDYRSYRCANLHTLDEWEWLDPLNTLIFFLTPNIIVIVTTIWLLVYTNKMAGIHKQAVVTMITVSLVFCISYAPIGVYLVAEKWILEGAGEDKHENFLYVQLYRYGTLVKFINNSTNPVIYYATITSFRVFVKEKVFGIKKEGGNSIANSASIRSTTLTTRPGTITERSATATKRSNTIGDRSNPILKRSTAAVKRSATSKW